MISDQKWYIILALSAALLLSSSSFLSAKQLYNSTAYLSSSWINKPSLYARNATDFAHTLTPILMRVTNGSAFICGFYCSGVLFHSKDCLFGVLISRDTDYASLNYSINFPELVWSANRNSPVQINGTLRLSHDGDLSLTDSNGTPVWSSQTRGKSVAGMNLTEDGNLVLFGPNNDPIWRSFDYPTDSLLAGQKLMRGQRLTASVSASNWSEGLLYLSLDNQGGLAAYVNSDPPQRYFYINMYTMYTNRSVNYNNSAVQFMKFGPDNNSAVQFMKFGPDGHLKTFHGGVNGWTELADLFGEYLGDCSYPLVCGKYGVCSSAGQCGCLETTSNQGSYFRQVNFRQPNLGCSLVTPVSCDHPKYHSLLELNNTYYFAFNMDSYEETTLVDDCKNRCLRNCSCKAALFAKDPLSNSSRKGTCLLLNEVFSIANNENHAASYYNTTLYVKVQDPYAKASRRKTSILASTFAAIFGVFFVIGSCLVYSKKRNTYKNGTEEDFLNQVPGMPTRYSYDNLKATTGDFSKKLGEGGFGSVYEGLLSDGTKVAVKCLDGLGKVKDSFLVEVKTIGSIHHVDLVKLIGYCYEKSHRLLVYEYMPNGSLDKWIFDGRKENHRLPWQVRRKIISDIAKGLAYLHEECSQKIIHLDIKPQNILLDDKFNAKISDFGISKLIEKDQSRVITKMRGTPGYLAPEWLSSAITEKVDVYSFGIVMLEMICGRKNLDWSKKEEDSHLLSVFKRKAEEDKLEELVEKGSEDMVKNTEEAVGMMRIAAWCLQGDFNKRPSMSLVVKVLEGLVAAETNLDYDFFNPAIATKGTAASDGTIILLPSELSGPR